MTFDRESVRRVGTAMMKKMAASKVKAEFWIVPTTAKNISVKDYESEDLGNSARSGEFILNGVLHVQPDGYTWSMQQPFSVRIELSEEPRSGTLVFNAAQRTGLDLMVVTAAHADYSSEKAVMSALGEVPFVEYEEKKSPEDVAWEQLKAYLRRNKLPTSTGRDRFVDVSEFMLMQPKPVRGHWQFKHSGTRNYVFVEARSGRVVVPKTDKPFNRGEFDKYASMTKKGNLFVSDRASDVEFLFDPFTNYAQVGMGGEWWNDTLKMGRNVIHHRKERVDDAYRPVTVNVEKVGHSYRFAIMGGFGGGVSFFLKFE